MSQTLELRIKDHEGFRNTVYLDTLGKKNCGMGTSLCGRSLGRKCNLH